MFHLQDGKINVLYFLAWDSWQTQILGFFPPYLNRSRESNKMLKSVPLTLNGLSLHHGVALIVMSSAATYSTSRHRYLVCCVRLAHLCGLLLSHYNS